MRELFKQFIIDFQQRPIPKPTRRDIELPKLPSGVRKAMVFIGMRRSGKTWFLFQKMHELMEEGVPQENLLYLNFEDDRLEDVTSKDLQGLLDAYFELQPDRGSRKDLHFFFDEIHEIPGWEKFIRRLAERPRAVSSFRPQ